jgi:hypothetical protein
VSTGRRLLLGVAAVGAALLGTILLVGARVPQGAVVAALERSLGYPLDIDHVRVRFLPQPALELIDVHAPDAGVVAGALAAFEAERIRLRLALGPLLTGQAVVDRMDLDAPLVRIVRPAASPKEAGAGAVKGRPAAPSPPTPAPRERRRERTGAPQSQPDDDGAVVRLRRVRVREGRLQFIDEATLARWALGRMHATVDLPADPRAPEARTHVEISASLRRGGRAQLAELSLDGQLAWSEGKPRFRGTLASGPFGFGPLLFDGGEGRLGVGPRGAHLRDLELRLGGGAVAGRARALLGKAPTVALSLAGHGSALEDAFAEGGVVVTGRWETQLAVHGPAPWLERARRDLQGTGRVDVRAGAIEPFELGSALLDVLAPLRGREQSQRLRKRYPDLFDEQHLRFARLGGSFRLERGRVHTRDLVVRGGGYRATGRGSVSVDGRLALGVRLALSAGLTRNLLGRGGLAALVGATPGTGLVIPLRLEGTVEHPKLRTRPEWSRALIRRTLGGSGMGDLLERLLR